MLDTCVLLKKRCFQPVICVYLPLLAFKGDVFLTLFSLNLMVFPFEISILHLT